MLLYVLICCVVFVFVFQVKFSISYQSFIVFIVREGVMVCNLKTDSNSEFGCPNTAENVRGVQERLEMTKGHFMEEPVRGT